MVVRVAAVAGNVAEDRMMTVHIFGLPIAACDPNKTWKAAADMIGRRLELRFGGAVRTVYVELYSPESFEFETIVKLLQSGRTPPFVTLNGRVIQSGGKLSERGIAQELARVLEEKTLQPPENKS